jgi:hypothetical protein
VAPGLVERLDATELDRVLIHEWAHVQRRDDLLHMLQIVVRILAGWHPAVWWIDRRLHIEREIACDELTVAITGSPKSYAACLLKLADLTGGTRAMLTAPAMLMAPGLRARVTKIVSPHRWIGRGWSRALAGAIVLSLYLIAAGLGRLTLVEAAALARPAEARSGKAADPMPELFAAGAPAAPSQPAETGGSDRQAAARVRSDRSESAQGQPAPPPSAPPRRSPEDATPPPAPVNVVETALPVSQGAGALPGVPLGDAVSRPPEMSATPEAAESPRAPWDVAAGAGKTVGRKSKDAGVATAGFFNRFARRVAGAF